MVRKERGSKHPSQYKGIVNKLGEEGEKCPKACSSFGLLHLVSFMQLTECLPLSAKKSGAKAWLLSALLANEDRNLPLSPPGN